MHRSAVRPGQQHAGADLINTGTASRPTLVRDLRDQMQHIWAFLSAMIEFSFETDHTHTHISLSLSHTHTHTYAHAHTHTHTYRVWIQNLSYVHRYSIVLTQHYIILSIIMFWTVPHISWEYLVNVIFPKFLHMYAKSVNNTGTTYQSGYYALICCISLSLIAVLLAATRNNICDFNGTLQKVRNSWSEGLQPTFNYSASLNSGQGGHSFCTSANWGISRIRLRTTCQLPLTFFLFLSLLNSFRGRNYILAGGTPAFIGRNLPKGSEIQALTFQNTWSLYTAFNPHTLTYWWKQ